MWGMQSKCELSLLIILEVNILSNTKAGLGNISRILLDDFSFSNLETAFPFVIFCIITEKKLLARKLILAHKDFAKLFHFFFAQIPAYEWNGIHYLILALQNEDTKFPLLNEEIDQTENKVWEDKTFKNWRRKWNEWDYISILCETD